MSFVQKFLEYNRRNNLIKDRDKILVCLSGGVDSTVLFSILEKIRKKYNLELGIAHINYCLRGEESEKDESLACMIAQKNSVPFFLKKIDLKKSLKKDKSSLQENARNIRYEFFEEIADANGYNKIAVAHNADDNAETVLLNLFRGTGLSGLRGIPVKREKIIRPLLFAERKEIMDFAKKNKIRFRHDKSNFGTAYNRNFIRLAVLPEIARKINPKTIQNISNFSSIFSDFEDFINCYIEEIYPVVVSKRNAFEICLDIQKFYKYINFIREKIVLKIVYDLINNSIGFQTIGKIINLAENQSGKRLIINKNLTVWKDRGLLRFLVKSNIDYKFPIELNDSAILKDCEITLKGVSKEEAQFSPDPSIEYVDKDKINDKIIIRKWKNSDYFFPIGLNKRKKVSDFLIDKKIPRPEKGNILILETGGKIIWICGQRLDERFKCEEGTKEILKLEIKYNKGIN